MSKRQERSTPDDAGRFAYEGLDRVIHERARLGILSSLAGRTEGLVFAELKQLCQLTDGNLNRHLQVLVEARLVTVNKLDGGGRMQTVCRLTALGRARFTEYIDELERVVADAAHARSAVMARIRRSDAGWSPA